VCDAGDGTVGGRSCEFVEPCGVEKRFRLIGPANSVGKNEVLIEG